MTTDTDETPIIEAAIRVARALRVGGCTDLDIIIEAALRTALPGDLLSHAVFDRAIALMRELYPEQFR